jgi:hypothetical protein
MNIEKLRINIKRMIRAIYLILISVIILVMYSCSTCKDTVQKDGIVIENAEFRLIIGTNGKAISLLHKPTGQECLQKDSDTPVFAFTQYRPYDRELFLTCPAKEKTFYADTVYRDGDNLIVGFELEGQVATIGLKITDDYIGFTLKSIGYKVEKIVEKRITEIDEFTLLQLPVKDRQYFGEWLNVIWDKDVAVNVLATDPYAKIDNVRYKGYHLLQAGMETNIKLMGVGAALITTSKEKLLDRIDKLEKDFNLPLGVQSRHNEAYNYSYYEVYNVTPQNIDENIAYAKKGGFRAMLIFCRDVASSVGHFPWAPEFPNGMSDLQTIVRKIKEAGMIPGFHFWYSKATKNDTYVTPVPDPRLNLVRIFTLAEPIDSRSTVITVEENPEGCTLSKERRFLKIGNELITYTDYTTTPPYQFMGCNRGALSTKITGFEKGFKFGLLDVDTWSIFVRFDQYTSIQQEVAKLVGRIYTDAGFQFAYFDGAEDVNLPYWHTVSKSQLEVFNCLTPAPLFSEGAIKSHFGWHILSRGNAFDVFSPETVKEATKKYPALEAKSIAQDFTSINFGWMDYVAPSGGSTGMQPDMYEYICSRSIAWDCPFSLLGKLDQLKAHSRTNDNLEVIRRWEEARNHNFFTEKQKAELKNLELEHILLINEKGEFELQPYKQIKEIAGPDNKEVRAFIFERTSKTCVVYWHISGEGELSLPVNADKVRLFKDLGKRIPVKGSEKGIIVPVGDRMFLEINLPEEIVIKAFKDAIISSGTKG